MTAAGDDLHHLVDRLSPRRAERLHVLLASDPGLASAAGPESQRPREVLHPVKALPRP
jgi:hypothetical protein